MAYINSSDYEHGSPARTGVLITNLGTPTAPTAKALRPFLKQFLSDPRVVEIPRLLWWLILNGIILNIRPRRSAKAYAEVWSEQGSPLAVHTQQQAAALQQLLDQRPGDSIVVEHAYRYGEPSMAQAIQSLLDRGVRRLLILPLYPQYSASTTASTFDAMAQDFSGRRWLPEFRFVHHYHDHPAYIQALAASVRGHWQQHGRADRLLFSYHGVPQRYLDNGDPYHCECLKTSRLLAEALQLGEGEYQTVFQSRFGREEWLKPYTDMTLKELPGEGVRSVQIMCPGFSADCLETLEEIAMENRDYFIEAGGEQYDYIPCLNEHEDHIAMMETLVEQHLQGWIPEPETSTT